LKILQIDIFEKCLLILAAASVLGCMKPVDIEEGGGMVAVLR
jgi:hypothetical protein